MIAPKQGELRVWWIPQVPGEPFHVPVANVAEAKKVMRLLAEYDAFQFAHRIKPDYCNVGGLECFRQYDPSPHPDPDYSDWSEWESEDGYNIDDYEVPA